MSKHDDSLVSQNAGNFGVNIYSRNLFIYTFNTEFSLKCFCCFITFPFICFSVFSSFVGLMMTNIMMIIDANDKYIYKHKTFSNMIRRISRAPTDCVIYDIHDTYSCFMFETVRDLWDSSAET